MRHDPSPDCSVFLPGLPPIAPESASARTLRTVLETACSLGAVHGIGVLAVQEALTEVCEWAVAGQNADESATAWLMNLRWARCAELGPGPEAPHPPTAWWEQPARRWAQISTATASASLEAITSDVITSDTAARSLRELAFRELGEGLVRSLTSAQMPYPARPVSDEAPDPRILLRLVPLAWHVQEHTVHLGQLAVNLTGLLTGHPEALASSLVWALLLRTAAGTSICAPEATVQQRLHRAVVEVRTLLVEHPSQQRLGGRVPPPGGLQERMRAAGGTMDALRSLLVEAPHTTAAVERGASEGMSTGDHSPACVRALATVLHRVETCPRAEESGEERPTEEPTITTQTAERMMRILHLLASGDLDIEMQRQNAAEQTASPSTAVESCAEAKAAARELIEGAARRWITAAGCLQEIGDSR